MDRHPPRGERSRSQVDRATSGRAIFVRKFRGYDRSLSSREKKGERRRSIVRRSAFAHSRRPETRLKCICDDNHSNAFSADQINEADVYIISKKRNREIRKQSEFPTSQILSGRAQSRALFSSAEHSHEVLGRKHDRSSLKFSAQFTYAYFPIYRTELMATVRAAIFPSRTQTTLGQSLRNENCKLVIR